MTYPSKKNYQEFITEVNKYREQKLLFQYKDVTNPKPPAKPLDILKQKKGLKTAQGNALTPQVAQLAPLEKENQLPGKFSKIVVTTDTPADRMDSLKKRVGRYGKGLQRMSDIYPNYP